MRMMPSSGADRRIHRRRRGSASSESRRCRRWNRDVHRTGNADGVGHLNLAAVSEAGSDDILRHIAAGVRGGTVNLRRVLAGERAAAVRAGAAVGVDDDLAAGQTGVGRRAAQE